MARILYYMCCSCCGICCNQKYEKRANPKEKMKTLKTMEEIGETDKQKAMSVRSDPTGTHLYELTEVVELPSLHYKTEDAVIEHYGFKVEEFIDRGSFAEVFKAIHLKKGLSVACKKISLTKSKDSKKPLFRLKDIKNELYILQKTRHPHIIRMLRHFVIVVHNISTLYVFMQFAVGGSLSTLSKLRGPFDERTCRLWFAQILNGLVFMHGMGFAHRDLKLGNILLDESHDVLISDFGLSRIAYRESRGGLLESDTYCGTPPFMAPELLSKKSYNAFAVDVWAIGTILYVLFNKDYPFPYFRQKWRTVNLMTAKEWHFTDKNRDSPSDGLKSILTAIFEPKPRQRPTMKALTKHHWIRTVYKKVDDKSKKLTQRFSSFKTEKSV